MTIGERVARLLDQQGKKAKDLAKYLDIDASSVTGWARGSYPSSRYIMGISQFFEVSIEYILTGEAAQKVTADGVEGISKSGLQIARLWDRLDERGQTIVKAKIYERLEVAEARAEALASDEAELRKNA